MNKADSITEVFNDLVIRIATPSGRKWFEGAADFSTQTYDHAAFVKAFAAAGRNLGRTAVTLRSEDESRLDKAGALFAPNGWALSDVGRAALLLRACEELPEGKPLLLVHELYYKGDNHEKEAVLRALSFLPAPERFAQVAVDACRAHVQTVFEAVACDNPYPAAFFQEMQFNQMVLKALFTGAPLDRIVGWRQRNNPELVRMAGAYASERRAANRPVPPDIQRIIDHARRDE